MGRIIEYIVPLSEETIEECHLQCNEERLIRCKDCRHYDGYVCKHEVDVRSRKPEWYCADAWERE